VARHCAGAMPKDCLGTTRSGTPQPGETCLGASLSEVHDILGHASPETTKRIYAHYETQHLRDAFDRYSASAEELVAQLPEHRRSRTSVLS
jgi:hypothetical protein